MGEKVHFRYRELPARREVSCRSSSAAQQKLGGLRGVECSREDTTMKCRRGEGAGSAAAWSSTGVARATPARQEQTERLRVMGVSSRGTSCEEGL